MANGQIRFLSRVFQRTASRGRHVADFDLVDPSAMLPHEVAERREIDHVDLTLIAQANSTLPDLWKNILEKYIIQGWTEGDIERTYPTLQGRAGIVIKEAVEALTERFLLLRKEAEDRIIPVQFNP